MALSKAMYSKLRDPSSGAPATVIENDRIYFQGGGSYCMFEGTPVLVDETRSLFVPKDVINQRPTTQSAEYRDRANVKNLIRQQLLPTLSHDGDIERRYKRLANQVSGQRVLILGAGDKAGFYRSCFSESEVVTSDVHVLFNVDIVCDAHQIPFEDDTFGAVLAGQVLEHTARPWIVAAEIERVVDKGGLIHIEVPFAFPLHSAPYDFFRFTPGGLRFLFPHSEVLCFEIPEGDWSAVAVSASNALINSFSNRYLRIAALVFGRVSLWWLKYLDSITTKHTFAYPKGYTATFRLDDHIHSDIEMLEDIRMSNEI